MCVGPPEGLGRLCCKLQKENGLHTMAKAIWNGQVLAESETYETVEGNIYFPEETVKREFLKPSSTTPSCAAC